MNDIEILEKYVKLLDDTITKKAIENLLKRNEELEAKNKELIHRIEKREYELDKKDKIINEYEKECKKTRAFARRIRKDEKRDIDQFNQGKEFASIQFLNLLANEPHWDYEGKYFDEVDREIGRYLKKAEGN